MSGSFARADGAEPFDHTVQRCRRHVILAAYRITGNIDDARDVAQFTFLQLFLKSPQLSSARSLDRWLYIVARNEALSVARRRSREDNATVADRSEAQPDDLAEAIVRYERAEQVRATISQLPPGDRHLIELRHFHAMPTTEMAVQLGMPLHHIRKRVERARWRLRAEMLRRGLDRDVE